MSGEAGGGLYYPDGADEEQFDGPVCEVDGENIDTYGGEHYWQCGRPGTITVDGTLMCEDHAGERGHGPKQEEYGFDLEAAPAVAAQEEN